MRRRRRVSRTRSPSMANPMTSRLAVATSRVATIAPAYMTTTRSAIVRISSRSLDTMSTAAARFRATRIC